MESKPNNAKNTELKEPETKNAESIILTTLNVQGFRSNKVCISKLLESTDILCIQEHWLFTFEKEEIAELTNTHSVYSKASDQYENISPQERTRGHGGVAIFWHNTLDRYVKTEEDGNNRIVCIQLQNEHQRLLLINVYMPCRNTHTGDNFNETLDQLQELLAKYRPTHHIIICGDINASLHRTPPNRQDQQLKAFCEEVNFSCNEETQPEHSFHHHNGLHSAKIDYILFGEESGDIVTKAAIFNSVDPINVSDHKPVTCKLKFSKKIEKTSTKTSKTNFGGKPNWSKCDIEKYRAEVKNNIRNIRLVNNTELEINQKLEELYGAIKKAEEASLPPRKNKLKKNNNLKWTPEIKHAVSISKTAKRTWREAGSPTDPNHISNIDKKNAKKKLRSVQRRQQAIDRQNLYSKISDSHTDQQKLFYHLVNKQRSTKTKSTDYITVENIEYLSTENIIEGWQLYFEKLAEPATDPRYDEEYGKQVMEDLIVIEDLCTSTEDRIQPTCQETIQRIIKAMKKGKAADCAGITAEHLSLAVEELTPILTSLINAIIEKREIPSQLKTGILTPVLKKGKNKTQPTSYRGITVTPLIGKIIESIIKEEIEPVLNPTQHQMQRGFTEDTSPLMAALLITEAINEAKDRGEGLYLSTLDAEKAFDVVWHASLLRKLFLDGIQGDSWLLIKSLHEQAHTKIKWGTDLSNEIEIKQGIRQGAKLSTTLYKRYNNGLLDSLETMNMGTNIGSENITSPTCADDLALLEKNTTNLQSLASNVYNHSCKDRFKINAQKSEIVSINMKKEQDKEPQIKLGDNNIQNVEQSKHLGIERNRKNTPDTEARIKTGRQTVYALMGAGMHGCNGISPIISFSMWTTFVTPRILHGIEMLDIRQKDLHSLETFQRKCLKQIQGLPVNTASAAVYFLLGAFPIEGLIDQRFLSTFGNILQNQTSLEFRLAKRQLLHKNQDSNSWFIKIAEILQKYNLENPFDLLENPPKKEHWKRNYKKKMKEYWTKKHQEEIAEKSSLKFLGTSTPTPAKPHLVWTSTKENPKESEKAMIKARIMTGTYKLQADRNKLTRGQQSSTCKLCNTETEDIRHFLLHCNTLKQKRETYLKKMEDIMKEHLPPETVSRINSTEDLQIQLIIDCTHPTITQLTGYRRDWLEATEKTSRGMIFALHRHRATIMRDVR